jgi:hypothetical protein
MLQEEVRAPDEIQKDMTVPDAGWCRHGSAPRPTSHRAVAPLPMSLRRDELRDTVRIWTERGARAA